MLQYKAEVRGKGSRSGTTLNPRTLNPKLNAIQNFNVVQNKEPSGAAENRAQIMRIEFGGSHTGSIIRGYRKVVWVISHYIEQEREGKIANCTTRESPKVAPVQYL